MLHSELACLNDIILRYCKLRRYLPQRCNYLRQPLVFRPATEIHQLTSRVNNQNSLVTRQRASIYDTYLLAKVSQSNCFSAHKLDVLRAGGRLGEIRRLFVSTKQRIYIFSPCLTSTCACSQYNIQPHVWWLNGRYSQQCCRKYGGFIALLQRRNGVR